MDLKDVIQEIQRAAKDPDADPRATMDLFMAHSSELTNLFFGQQAKKPAAQPEKAGRKTRKRIAQHEKNDDVSLVIGTIWREAEKKFTGISKIVSAEITCRSGRLPDIIAATPEGRVTLFDQSSIWNPADDDEHEAFRVLEEL